MLTNYLKTWFLKFSLRKRQKSTNKCHSRWSICLLGITCLSQSTFIPARIGIRSEDIQTVFEKSVKGSGIALSSPRLVIPAAIYALWILSHKFLANDFFDFQVRKDYIYIFYFNNLLVKEYSVLTNRAMIKWKKLSLLHWKNVHFRCI